MFVEDIMVNLQPWNEKASDALSVSIINLLFLLLLFVYINIIM